jgi:hypothetical protein
MRSTSISRSDTRSQQSNPKKEPTDEPTIVPSTEKLVASGDGRLATQAFGDPSDPAVLLIKGQMASMLWWPEPFCRRPADRGRFVTHHDYRDTGPLDQL